jgi:hypothetical protein
MISALKANTNRANAQASTGPKSARGKARASRNARRHGLSLAIGADPVLSEKVEKFARAIAGETNDVESPNLRAVPPKRRHSCNGCATGATGSCSRP